MTSWSLLVSTYVSSLVMFQSIGRFVVFHLPPSLVLLCQSIHSNQLSHVDIIECQPLWLLNLSQTPPYLCLQLISFLIHCQWSDYVGLLDLEVAETTHCLEIIHISVHVAFIAFKIYFRLNLHMGVIKKKSHFLLDILRFRCDQITSESVWTAIERAQWKLLPSGTILHFALFGIDYWRI